MRSARWGACLVAVALALFAATLARADSGLGPADAEKTMGQLKYLCLLQSLCPLTAEKYELLKRAMAGQRDSQLRFGLDLITGDGVPTDRAAGMAWVVKAAEQGAPFAVMYLEHKLQNGERAEFDETKAATALKKEADAGGVSAMRALAPMLIRGRGAAQDPGAGIAMLKRAAERDPGGQVAWDIAELYLIGTNGLRSDHEEAMKWYAISASRGNLLAMATLGGLWENAPAMDMKKLLETGKIPEPTFTPDIVQSYCWRVRAALLDSNLAQYELALMRSRHASDRRGNDFQPDIMEADYWFRLGARDREYDNSQVRGDLEPKMTTAQLEQVQRRVAAWHTRGFEEMKAEKIAVPGGGDRLCPPMEVPSP